MDLVKSHWVAGDNRVSLSMPIAKIDRENRLVSGFATLDNVDTGDDVVMASASAGAFTRFRGNIREMHEPIAAGRLVDFREESFYDSKTQKFYNGIYATAYVSKGAENTWEKVLDGTLSGFSIGGNIIKQSSQYVADLEKTVRYIEEYDLVELSLVDNPANQLANVFSIVKNQSGDMMMKGMAVDTHLVNVFWCATDEIAKNSTSESETCLSCGSNMEQIGWFEKGEDEAVKTAAAVAGFLRQKEVNADNKKQNATGEGGVDMADKIEKSDDVVTSEDTTPVADETVVSDEVLSEEADAVEEVPTTATEEVVSEEVPDTAAEVDEAPTDPDLEKMFDDLKDSVRESIEKTVASVEKKVEEVSAAFDNKASELEKSLTELSASLEAIKNDRGDVTKRLDALEKASAIKKSGEVETEPVTKVKKGLWGGTFFDGE